MVKMYEYMFGKSELPGMVAIWHGVRLCPYPRSWAEMYLSSYVKVLPQWCVGLWRSGDERR